MMRCLVTIIVLVCCLQAHSLAEDEPAAQARKIIIATTELIARALPEVFTEKSCDLSSFPEQHYIPRGAIEIFLLCKVFYQAGFFPDIKILALPNYKRALAVVSDGEADIAGETIWESDIDHQRLLESSVVIHEGELEKGLYAHADSPLHRLSPDQFNYRHYRALSISNWYQDNEVLEQITKNIEISAAYKYRFDMLKKGRADYILMNFPRGPNLEINIQGFTLRPIPNLKVALPQSRHYVVYKSGAKSVELIKAINYGLSILRDRGDIEIYKEHMGINNPRTKKWVVLNGE